MWKPLVNVGGHGQVGVLDRSEGVMYWHLEEPYHTAFNAFGWQDKIPRRAVAVGLERAWLAKAVDEGLRVRVFVRNAEHVVEVNDPDVWIGFVERTGSIYAGRTQRGKVLPPLYELPLLIPEFFREVKPTDRTAEAFAVLNGIHTRYRSSLLP